MKSIGSLIRKSSLKKKPRLESLDEKTLFFVVKKILLKEFGSLGAEKFLPHHYSKKTLTIRSDSAPWVAELWTNQERIIRKINEELGGEILEKIKLKLGK
jgi:predicted nucleic acid-binding Zn ribbon protein